MNEDIRILQYTLSMSVLFNGMLLWVLHSLVPAPYTQREFILFTGYLSIVGVSGAVLFCLTLMRGWMPRDKKDNLIYFPLKREN